MRAPSAVFEGCFRAFGKNVAKITGAEGVDQDIETILPASKSATTSNSPCSVSANQGIKIKREQLNECQKAGVQVVSPKKKVRSRNVWGFSRHSDK